MQFVKMGFRNLFRQKRRTLITLAVITFGIGCLLLACGHSRYIAWGLMEMTIHTETGHIQVFGSQYPGRDEETVLQHGLERYEAVREELLDLVDVSIAAARIECTGLISNGEKSAAFMGSGLEPALELRMRSFFSGASSIYDTLAAYETDDDVIALGSALARSLNVRKGDYLTLISTTTDGALNAIDVRYVGSFQGSSPEYDARAAIMPLRTAQRLLNTDKVRNLVITLDETEDTDRLHGEILHLLRGRGYRVDVRTWPELARYYHKVKAFYHQMTGFLSLVLFIIVFFSTANTIMISVIERTTEIGTMLSIGTSRWQTLKVFFFEGLFVGIFGGFLSALFAICASAIINRAGIMLPAPPGLTMGYPLSVRNEPDLYLQIFAWTVAVVTVSSIVSALRVTRMKIVDALGHI